MTAQISVRPFRRNDFPKWTALYNAAFGIIGADCEFDETSMRQYISQPTSDPERDCFIAQNSDDGVGLVIVWPELPIRRAVIEIGVVPGHEGKDVAEALVKAAIDRTSELPVSVVHAQVPSGDERRKQVFRDARFRTVRQYATMRWCRNGLPEPDVPNGFAVRSFQVGQDEQRLTDIQNTAFGDSWGFSPNTVEEIKTRAGFKSTTPEGIVFLMKGAKPIAYNWTVRPAGPGGSLGRIAMTGVHPDYRGRRLSRPTVVAGMRWLVSQGVEVIELEMDAANAPAAKVYESLGFDKISDSVWYELQID